MKPLSLFLQALSLSSTLTMIQPTSGQNLIRSICKNTSKTDPDINYNFCKTSLQAAPGGQCATIQGLGSISIRLLYDNITDTRCHIKQLLKNKKLEPSIRTCLNGCFLVYNNAIPSAKLVMGLYRARKFDDLNNQISAIIATAESCENAFEEMGVISPLMKRNNDTIQIAVVALSFISST